MMPKNKHSIDSYPCVDDAGSLFMREGGGMVVFKKGRSSVVEIKRANNKKIGHSTEMAMRPKALR